VTEALNRWLEAVETRGIKLGLEKIRRALELASQPQRSFPSVLVGGTNGKGSTVAFAESLLSAAGHRVGSTVSPHLHSYRERFRVGGVLAAEAQLEVLARQLRPRIDACPELAGLTFFELGVLLAMCHFRDSSIDVAVVEVGMGGEFDASRACEAGVAALVSVDMDHQQFLGDTIESISRTKARLAPAGGALVVGEQREDRLTVIREEAQAVDCALILAGRDFSWSVDDGLFSYRGPSLSLDGVRLGLQGGHQGQNAACALALVETLTSRRDLSCPSAPQCTRALGATRLAGRLERLPAASGRPAFLLDGAHNPAGAEVLARVLSVRPRPRRRYWLYASMADKQRAEVLASLLPHVDSVMCTVGTSSPRFESPSRLAEQVAQLAGPAVSVATAETSAHALQALLAEATAEDEVLVAGSLYLVGDVRSLLGLPLG